ncbi:MAG TPA: hypothetical protein VEK10_06755 [Steroidobacteraceae bacterium]|nr:hypothetical protein [Steroidobacteraceae bacterium]
MPELSSPERPFRSLSRRSREELSALQASVREQGTLRESALRMFVVSRQATTTMAQREFWLEFVCADQEYRIAVRRLAQFCLEHRHGSPRTWRMV